MRGFDYRRLPADLFSADMSDRLAYLHECRGKLKLMEQMDPAALERLYDRTCWRCALASTHIEGIYPDEQRAKGVATGALEPASDPECELVGYADAARMVDSGYHDLPLAPSVLLAMHKVLYGHTSRPEAGVYRRRDHIYTQVDGRTEMVPVSPVSAFETPLCLGAATDAFISAEDGRACDALVLIPVFIVDLLCIRPFEMGDGRMSRLVTQLLLLRSGISIGRYYGIEQVMEADAAGYYDALNASVIGWDRARNDYLPFSMYFLDVLGAVYEKVFGMVDLSGVRRPGKSERVRMLFDGRIGSLTKSQIAKLCPDVSVSTIEMALGNLVKEGYLRKVGAGRTTAYMLGEQAGDR